MCLAGLAPTRRLRLMSNVRPRKGSSAVTHQQMKPTTSLFLKYQGVLAVLATAGALVQWYKSDWRASLIVFFGMIAVLNLPLIYYVAKSTIVNWWVRRQE